MKKITAIVLALAACFLLASCGNEEDTGISAETIEAYKAQITQLEERIIKLNEEIAVKDSLIEELIQDERQVEDQLARRQAVDSYYSELEKSPSFNGGPQAYTLQGPLSGNYSIDRGLQTLDKIKSALDSFTAMTALVRERSLLDEDELRAIGNTGESIQYAEFYNMPVRIKGQIMEQNYIIKALDLRRVLALYELGRVEKEEVDIKYKAFLEAREKYQEFISSTFYRDGDFYAPPFYY
ncbi:MAG TPA: hypothetical protein PK369_09790 [Thermoclostridium sp.]|nr:hypothetical protein [Clostridiaceae bacterium]HOQ76843.1 hypothetical protein [Thermoclostridium sp.]